MDSKSRYYEGCGQEGPVLCIFLCEFHPTYGPKISCQVPKEFISKETFESVNVYLIPKPQLIRSIITVTLDDIKIVGYPVRIQNEKYPRNAFYYNLCFVCNSWARSNQYDQVVKDLSAHLRQLEEDENLLSKMDEEGGDPNRVTTLFSQVLSDLNTNRLSYLQDGKRSLVLRVGRKRQVDLPAVSVPMLVRQRPSGSAVDSRDPTLLNTVATKILHFVDGLNQVERIATLTDVEINQVKACLQNLVSDGTVKMVPEFNDSSEFIVTPRLRSLFLDRHLQNECLTRVSLPGGLANIRDVTRVLASLDRGSTVKDLCFRFDMAQMRIDEKKLVQFGLLHGLVRKLNKHVNFTGVDGGGSSEEASQYKTLLDGVSPYEVVCAQGGFTRQQLDFLTLTHPAFVTICK